VTGKKTTAREPLLKCRNVRNDVKTAGRLHILSNFYLLLLPGCVVLKKGKQGVKRFSKEGRN